MSPKPSEVNKIIKMLKTPQMEDKVICFIPQWERGGDYLFSLKSPEKDYKFDEQRLFYFVMSYLLRDEILSFVAYEGDKNDDIKIIQVIPNTAEFESILHKKLRSHFEIKVLCIDYKFLCRTISYDFLRHTSEPILGLAKETETFDKDASPLFRLFRDVSFNTKFAFRVRVEQIIETIEKGEFSDREQDLIEFYSKNHIQNFVVPSFWNKVRDKGFLCEYNKLDTGDEDKKMSTDGLIKEDIRVFYSFESLLYWELKNIFIEKRRCENCNAVLPLKYTGKYCPGGSPGYEKCRKKRQNMRSAKSYRKKSRKNF